MALLVVCAPDLHIASGCGQCYLRPPGATGGSADHADPDTGILEALITREVRMPDEFRALMSRVPTSVVVAAALVDDQPIGMMLGTFTSVSLDPRLVGFFGDLRSRTFGLLVRQPRLAFSVLAQEHYPEVTDAFRRVAEHRFDGVSWHLSPSGLPRLDGSVLFVEGPIVGTGAAGDHLVVHVDPDVVEQGTADAPLVFYRGLMMTIESARVRQPVWQLGSIDWDAG